MLQKKAKHLHEIKKDVVNRLDSISRLVRTCEELLIKPDPLQKIWILRKLLYSMDEIEAMEFILDKMKASKNNAEFFEMMRRGG
jgi:transcription termination factor Rho